MKINNIIAAALIGAVLSLEAWTLKEVVALKVQVAALTVRLDVKPQEIAKN